MQRGWRSLAATILIAILFAPVALGCAASCMAGAHRCCVESAVKADGCCACHFAPQAKSDDGDHRILRVIDAAVTTLRVSLVYNASESARPELAPSIAAPHTPPLVLRT
jgi:hypothetical protein